MLRICISWFVCRIPTYDLGSLWARNTDRLTDGLQRRFFLVRIHLPLFRLIADLEVLRQRIQYSGLCEAFETAY
jgi:hypothetical protein